MGSSKNNSTSHVKGTKKTILIQTKRKEQYDNFFLSGFSDNRTEPFIKLKERIEGLGYILENANFQAFKDITQLVVFDSHIYSGRNPFRIIAHKKNLVWIADLKKSGLKPILILWEGPSNKSFRKEDHIGYDTILTWNDAWVDNIRYFKYYLPTPNQWGNIVEKPFHEKKLLVNISYNKTSKHPQELYSERVNTIEYFDEHYSKEFDLFGFGWNIKSSIINNIKNRIKPQFAQTSFKTYRGPIENKWDIFPSYKFGLCYENIRSEQGYVTEKIFDCMRSNCVPIYWGAPNIDEYVDSNAFIDRKQFRSNEELGMFLNDMQEKEYNQYLFAIKKYLLSERFKKFLSSSFAERIIKTLKL